MKSYLVTYDLIKRKDYPKLFEALKKFGSPWHCLLSVWIIKSDLTAAQIFDLLSKEIDSDDKLIVVALVRDAKWSGSFPDQCRQWLMAHL